MYTNKNSDKIKAFSLIELLIVLAMIAILAGVIYPYYGDAVTRSRRAEAMSALAKIAVLQEQYFTDHRRYTTDMTDLGFSTDPYISEQDHYSLDTLAVMDIEHDYIIIATALNGQAKADSDCQLFTWNYLGEKTANNGEQDTSLQCW